LELLKSRTIDVLRQESRRRARCTTREIAHKNATTNVVAVGDRGADNQRMVSFGGGGGGGAALASPAGILVLLVIIALVGAVYWLFNR
jgi:hypothetical protein